MFRLHPRSSSLLPTQSRALSALVAGSGQAVPVPEPAAASAPQGVPAGGGRHPRLSPPGGKGTEGRSCRGSFKAPRVTSRSRPVCPGRGGTVTAPTAPGLRRLRARQGERRDHDTSGLSQPPAPAQPPARASSPGAKRCQP